MTQHPRQQGNFGGDIERHRKHLAQVPPDVVKRRTEEFRLKPDAFSTLPLICVLGKIRPRSPFLQWVHPMDPVTINDLKNWVGVPNTIAKREMHSGKLDARAFSRCGCGGPKESTTMHLLPRKREFDFEKLEPEQRIAVRQMARQLLFGYVDMDAVKQPPLAGVVSYMLLRAARAPFLIVPDLIVCPDHVVTIEGFPAAVFNNILIYGNGEIALGNDMKLHAHQITHVAA
jgi:hypothetical protein